MIPYRLLIRRDDQLLLVHEGQMPPFQIAPQVVIWGERIFHLDISNQNVTRRDYIEAFTWAAVS